MFIDSACSRRTQIPLGSKLLNCNKLLSSTLILISLFAGTPYGSGISSLQEQRGTTSHTAWHKPRNNGSLKGAESRIISLLYDTQPFTVELYLYMYSCILWRYLDFAMNPALIRQQDFFTVIGYIASNSDANRHLWDWTRANYDELVERWCCTVQKRTVHVYLHVIMTMDWLLMLRYLYFFHTSDLAPVIDTSDKWFLE